MLTPQEVASHSFTRATLGGYNMAMVDEFLDTLTEDYTTLYNDNAILKNKLKVLSDTVEEYRATDAAMRKTLLAAQQMADNMVSDAERQKAAMVHDAETEARRQMDAMHEQYAVETARLERAKAATADFILKAKALLEVYVRTLEGLSQLTSTARTEIDPPTRTAEPAPVVERPAAPAEPVVERRETVTPDGLDLAATRRFEDLQFGRDYEIT